MSALQLVDNAASYFELDYISGSSLPKSASAADLFLSSFQVFTGLDTLTGYVPDTHVRQWSEADSKAVFEWMQSDHVSLVEALQKAEADEPRDRVSPRASFEPLNEWEGYVVSTSDSEFVANLLDLTAGSESETDMAVFSLDDVSDDDKTLVQVGAIFRWSLGYERKLSGSRRKVSSIVFRRLPIWTAREIAESMEKAQAILRSITWE